MRKKRKEFIAQFGNYFGELLGFYELVVDVYKEELKDELIY